MELCKTLLSLLEGLISDETKTSEGLLIFNLENNDVA